ncbi:MAG: ion channel, partial [Gemmataceae bacterium]
MHWLFRHTFRLMMIVLLLLVLAYPFLGQFPFAPVIYVFLVSGLFGTAFLAAFQQRRYWITWTVLGIPVLAATWLDLFVPNDLHRDLHGALSLLMSCFLVFTILCIYRVISRESEITTELILAAFCGYILIGLVFAHLYGLMEYWHPGSFQMVDSMAADLGERHRRYFLMTYFSFTTLSTLGYGDILPKTDFARGFVLAEAVLGQFYLAVLIAELIGRKVGGNR